MSSGRATAHARLQRGPRLGDGRMAIRLPARGPRPALVPGVPGLRHYAHVARVGQRHGEMGDAFFRADERMQLAERIEPRAEAASQVGGGGFTERGQTELERVTAHGDRKSTRLNSSHSQISYAVFCLKKKQDTSDAHDKAQNLRR